MEKSLSRSSLWRRMLPRARKLLGRLIEPSPEIKDPGERRRARLLSMLLIVINLALILRFVISPQNRGLFLIFIAGALTAYFLSRSRYQSAAAWTIIVDLTFPSYLQILTLPGLVGPAEIFSRFAWLAFPIVLCGLIQSNRAVTLLTGLNLLGMGLIAWWMPTVAFWDVLPAMGFIFILGVLVITATRQRVLIEEDRQEKEIQRERKLNEVNQAISSALNLTIVLESVIRVACELTEAEGGLLSLLAADGEHFEQVLGFGLPENQVSSRPTKGNGVAWEIIKTNAPVVIEDYSKHPHALSKIKDAASLHGYLGVPIRCGQDCLGSLAVASTSRRKRFSSRDLDLLEVVARQAGIAIQNARLYSALETELVERSRVEAALRQRDTILEAVAQAAGLFLQSQDWTRYVQTVLAQLGSLTHSSHTYIFQNHPSSAGITVTSQIYQWSAPDIDPALQQIEFQNLPLEGIGLERWRAAMLRGEPFYGNRSSFLPGEEIYLAPLGALSILEMPVYLQPEYQAGAGPQPMEWWGLIGFDDYSNEREWTPAEVDAIRIAAGILSAAIQRQQFDLAARQASIQLEKRVQERTIALEMANKEMEAFAYSVSHDLRAPLRAIDGYSRILKEDYQDRMENDGLTCLSNIHQAIQKMNQLIDDLLQLSRITRQEMVTGPVDLSALAYEILENYRQQEPDRAAQITIQPGMVGIGDPNLLRIAITNLLDNAWKFTRKTPNTCIEVGCRLAGEIGPQSPGLSSVEIDGLGADMPVYFVKDNGAGFDMRYAGKLFQAFQRLHTPLEFEGTGIGLATVRRIILRHQGQLWAEGVVSQGATFYFTLNSQEDELLPT
jgi:signal transduction histidine kinase